MTASLVAGLSVALLLVVAVLIREVRLRKAMQRLLRSLLTRLWRCHAHETNASDDSGPCRDPARHRL